VDEFICRRSYCSQRWHEYGGCNLSIHGPEKKLFDFKSRRWFLASELAREVGPHGIPSVTQNPGNLKTNLLIYTSKWIQLAVSPLLCKAEMGVYTELRAGLSSELTIEVNGGYVIPWGRIHPSPPKDLIDPIEKHGARGNGSMQAKFRDWCGKETAEYTKVALISLGNIGYSAL
jgi:hypothetical protein